MDPFVHDQLAARVVFGRGAARERLAKEVERLGAERVLLIAAEPERELAEGLVAALGDRVAGRFHEGRPHVPVEIAERARAAAAAVDADGLLCVGGGSTTGTAKAIALTSGLPIVAVPTTYAGSEMTPVWGLTEGQRKTTGRDVVVAPKVVVYDAELTVSLPASISATSAMNAIAHCVEAFYAPGSSPIACLMAEEGIRASSRGAELVVADLADAEGRDLALYGAYLAGAAFAIAGSALHHKICHVLGGAYDLPHADLHTVVLPHAVAYNEPALPEEMGRVAAALGGASSAAEGLFDLAQRLGAPTALRDIGLREDDLDEAAALVLEKVPADNPRPIDLAGVRQLLDDAFAGRRPAGAGVGAQSRS
jgi:maleylacetate reductase